MNTPKMLQDSPPTAPEAIRVHPTLTKALHIRELSRAKQPASEKMTETTFSSQLTQSQRFR